MKKTISKIRISLIYILSTFAIVWEIIKSTTKDLIKDKKKNPGLSAQGFEGCSPSISRHNISLVSI